MGKARNVYFRDAKLWERLEKIAAEEDRSVNYILEKMVAKKVADITLIEENIKAINAVQKSFQK